MKSLSIYKNKKSEIISQSVKVLKGGGVIVYPTETAYGLGADFLNPKAVKKVYQIKGRSFNKPLSVIVSSLTMAKELVRFNKTGISLAKKYWPGPLTLVLPARNLNQPTLALRISSDELATAIARKLGGPLISTSANISGKVECYSIADVEKNFQKRKYQPDLLIDGGNLSKNKPSTIVALEDDEIKILRQGKISFK